MRLRSCCLSTVIFYLVSVPFAAAFLLATPAPTSKVVLMSLSGRRVLVTGGGRGIGKAIAQICAEEGADVAVLSRTAAEVNEVVEDLCHRFGRQAMGLQVDVTNEVEVSRAVAQVISRFGGIDLLVNNAGMGCDKVPAHEQSVDAFRKLLDVNVVSAFIVSKEVHFPRPLRPPPPSALAFEIRIDEPQAVY